MPFGPITVNSKTFNQAGEGVYKLSTLTFGQPSNHFSVKGGSINKGRTAVVTAVSRTLEKDVVIDGTTTRKSANVQLVITVPPSGFTSAEVDVLASDISEFLTAGTLDRLLGGES